LDDNLRGIEHGRLQCAHVIPVRVRRHGLLGPAFG